MEPTPTRKAYEEALDRLKAVARTYVQIPESDETLEAEAVANLKDAAVDFAHAEKAAWEAGDFASVVAKVGSPTF
jgi:hypothetical protein